MLNSHKSLYIALTGATVLHLSLLGLPTFYFGAAVVEDRGSSALSIKIAQMPAHPEPVESEIITEKPQENIIREEIPESVPEKAPETPPKKKPETVARTKPAKEIRQPANTATDVSPTARSEPVAQESHRTPDNIVGSNEQPDRSQQVDPVKQWLAMVQQRINKNRRYPRAALSRGLEGDVQVEAAVAPDGTLLETKILSGPKIFRSASLNALKKSFPFPPPEKVQEPVKFRFTIHYRIK